jgi:hypothetical protein
MVNHAASTIGESGALSASRSKLRPYRSAREKPMTPKDYLLGGAAHRLEAARAHPKIFLLTEFGRYAATMALILAIGDVIWRESAFVSPIQRLFFIGFWAAAMAAVSLWRSKRRNNDKSDANGRNSR